MALPFLDAAQVAQIKALPAQGFATAMAFWADAYEVWRTERPTGWDTGADPEDVRTVESGVGRLYEAGSGGEQGDTVIVGFSPYRFRLPATTALTATDLLVVNGRAFLVESVSRGDAEDAIAEAFLRERT